MTRFAFVEGSFCPEDEARIPVSDLGLLQGHSVFETIRAIGTTPLFLHEHIDRLRRSADRTMIPWRLWGDGVGSPGDYHAGEVEIAAALRKVIVELLDRNQTKDARVRVTLTKGRAGARGPTWIVTAAAIGQDERPPEDGVSVCLAGRAQPSIGSFDPTIKSGSRIHYSIAREQARARGAWDAILCNESGQLAEGTSSNLFWVADGRLETPAIGVGLLPGIMRATLLDLAGADESIAGPDEVKTGPERIEAASEVMLTNSLWGVLPVLHWGEAVVGTGSCGPVTKRMADQIEMTIRNQL